MEKIKDVKPFGSTILVELLSAEEALGTVLALSGSSVKTGAPQGIIAAFGKNLKPEDVGLKVGDRVLLQGNYVPAPNYDNSKRERGLIEIHNVKAILT